MDYLQLTALLLILYFVITNKTTIMAKIDELVQAVADLQITVDTKQAQIAAAIATFEQTIADLTALIGNAPTDAQLQSVIDTVAVAKADLEATPVSTPPTTEENEA